MKRSRSGQVNKPTEQNRMSKYFHATKDNIKHLSNAYKSEDIESMREVLAQNTDTGFLGNLYKIYDADFKEGIVKTILRKNYNMLPKEDRELEFKKKLKPKYQVSNRVLRFKQRQFKQRKQIKQVSKSGKVYTRTKPKRFSTKEVKFLKINKGLKSKELVKRYNKLFVNRTYSSIVSKKNRVK